MVTKNGIKLMHKHINTFNSRGNAGKITFD